MSTFLKIHTNTHRTTNRLLMRFNPTGEYLFKSYDGYFFPNLKDALSHARRFSAIHKPLPSPLPPLPPKAEPGQLHTSNGYPHEAYRSYLDSLNIRNHRLYSYIRIPLEHRPFNGIFWETGTSTPPPPALPSSMTRVDHYFAHILDFSPVLIDLLNPRRTLPLPSHMDMTEEFPTELILP